MHTLTTKRRRFPLLRTAFTGALAVGAGCSDPTNPGLTPTPRALDAPAGATGTAAGEFNTVSRFTVHSAVSGDLRPGRVVDVVTTISANLATKDAHLSISTPEVDLASANRYAPSAKLTGVPTDPRVEERASFGGAGEERTLRTSFTVTEPGYYRVVIAARAPTDPAMQDQRLVQNVVYDEVWFTVTADGGRVTQGYDAEVFPKGAFQQPGPFRALDAPVAAAASTTSALMLDPMTLQMSYYNMDAAAYEPLGDARYRLVVSPGNITYAGQTNANGEFTFPCAAAGSTGTLDVWHESAGKASVIRPSPFGTNAFHGFINVTICGGYTAAAVDPSSDGNYTARIYTNALITVNTSRAYFPTRPAVSFRFSTNSPDTYYSKSDDQIHIDWQSTWAEYGIFTVAHEYGHAVHHIVLGGIKDDSGTCGATHLFDQYTNYGCAYAEGFGNYHAAVVRGSAGGFLFSKVASGLDHGGQNGAINEMGSRHSSTTSPTLPATKHSTPSSTRRRTSRTFGARATLIKRFPLTGCAPTASIT